MLSARIAESQRLALGDVSREGKSQLMFAAVCIFLTEGLEPSSSRD